MSDSRNRGRSSTSDAEPELPKRPPTEPAPPGSSAEAPSAASYWTNWWQGMKAIGTKAPAAAKTADANPEALLEQASRRVAARRVVIREAEEALTLRPKIEEVLSALRGTPALPGRPWSSATTVKTQLDRYLRDLAELAELIAVTDRAWCLVLEKADADEHPEKQYAAEVLLLGAQRRWADARRRLVKLVLAWPGTELTAVRIRVDKWLRVLLPCEIFAEVLPTDFEYASHARWLADEEAPVPDTALQGGAGGTDDDAQTAIPFASPLCASDPATLQWFNDLHANGQANPPGRDDAAADHDVTGLFSLRENAIAKEPRSSYLKPWRCVSRLGL
jgi:hypothetical protein